MVQRETPNAHAHHWRIDEPDGRVELDAVCLGCGAQTTMRSWLESYDPGRLGGRRSEAWLRSDPEAAISRMVERSVMR